MITATVAVNGGGMTQIFFIKGRIRNVRMMLRPDKSHVTVEHCNNNSLKLGRCHHYWFEMDIDEAQENEFLKFRVTCSADSQMHITPHGYSRTTIETGPDTKEVSITRQREDIFAEGRTERSVEATEDEKESSA